MRVSRKKTAGLDQAAPASRPFRELTREPLLERFEHALTTRDGVTGGPHCVHELWMRGEISLDVETLLERLWSAARESAPDSAHALHRMVTVAYEVAGRFEPEGRGRSNIYLVLLDYRDSRDEPYGVYVGASRYAPADRFDQHKAGIRAAGSVLRRGLEVLTGPVLHLQRIPRAQAADIEERLAEALRAEGLFVQGGH